MAETAVPKGLVQCKPLQLEEWVRLHERLSSSYHEFYEIQLRTELIQAFAQYESDKTEDDKPIQIHAIALILSEIAKLITTETEKLWHLHMDFFPYDAKGCERKER